MQKVTSLSSQLVASTAALKATKIQHKAELNRLVAKEKAKARLRQTIVAIPFIGATAFAAFELNDFRKWKKENPSKEKSAYTCETASVYADLINEVLLELPENARPSERTINSLIEMCEN